MSALDTTGYKYDSDIADDLENLKDFGEINKITGELDFKICKTCNGPHFGHKGMEEDCDNKTRSKKYKDDETKTLMDYFRNLTCFKCLGRVIADLMIKVTLLTHYQIWLM